MLSLPANSSPDTEVIRRDLIIARLKAHGLRVTPPRIALLAALSGSPRPMTIEQLSIQVGNTTCDLVTVYRSMAAFEKAGVVYRSGFSDRGAALYNVDGGGNRRYPLVTKGTAVVEELDQESAFELEAAISRIKNRLLARGYKGLDHIVEFFASSTP
jgi:Fur family transcriptional regulator, ferric uptake regulator